MGESTWLPDAEIRGEDTVGGRRLGKSRTNVSLRRSGATAAISTLAPYRPSIFSGNEAKQSQS
jgi:hypothetical protein